MLFDIKNIDIFFFAFMRLGGGLRLPQSL